MIRNYEKAIHTYESVVSRNGTTKSIRKKMIICYIRTSKIEKALAEFCKLVEEDIMFLTNTDLKAEDCPCAEIISEIENDEIHYEETEKHLAMGILWIYCDLKISLQYFDDYMMKNQNNSELNNAYQIIKAYSQNTN